MASHVLLVSNPPHSKIDVQTAAAVLGLLPVDANLKVRYGIPEIWLADQNLEDAQTRLANAGMRSVLVTSEELQGVATARLIRRVNFTDDSTVLDDVDIPNSEAAIVIPSAPRAAEGAPPNLRSEIAPGIIVHDTCPFIDIYLPNGARFALYGELLDFSALAEQKTASMQRNMIVLAQILKARLKCATFDDRLLNMQLRRRAGHGVPINFKESRKGFSFASPGLDELLTDISPELAGISQTELLSRLAYLSTRTSLGAIAGGA